MNIDLALENFDVLKNLPENTRLYASSDEKLSYDNRWFTGARRAIEGSSREDILTPINKTFITLAIHDLKNSNEMIECIHHVKNNLKTLYPDFSKLQMLLDELVIFISNSMNDNDIDKVRSSNSKILEGIINDLKALEIKKDDEHDNDDVNISDMDDTENISDMDDTEDQLPSLEVIPLPPLPPLIIPEAVKAENCRNTFEDEIKIKIVPKLEEEADRIIKSYEDASVGVVGVVGVTKLCEDKCDHPETQETQIKRRFIKISRDEHQEYVSIHIPQFFNIEKTSKTPKDMKLLDSESSDSDSSESCLDKIMANIEDDINGAVESTAELCRSLGKFVTKYL